MNRYVGAAHEMGQVFSDGVSIEPVMVLHFAFPVSVATCEAKVSRCRKCRSSADAIDAKYEIYFQAESAPL